MNEKLKELLAERGIAQVRLAELLGRDKAVVTNLLQGKRQLKFEEALKIAEFLGVHIHELMEEESAPGLSDSAVGIPFQGEPSPKALRSGQVVKQDGRFYLRDTASLSSEEYALEMRDSGLNLSGILQGDILRVVHAENPPSGSIVVAQHYQQGSAETVVRYFEPPLLLPRSSDAQYKPIHTDADDIRIAAVVKQVIRLV